MKATNPPKGRAEESRVGWVPALPDCNRRSAEQTWPSGDGFRSDDRVGGLLMYGIPNMKLEQKRSSGTVVIL